MSTGITAATIDIVNSVVQDFELEVDEDNKETSYSLYPATTAPKSPASEIHETIKNMTSTGFSYSSSLDASRSHLRVKMSSGSSLEGHGLPGGRSSMTIPSLLQKLPCHGNSTKSSGARSSIGASEVTLSALNVIETPLEIQDFHESYFNLEVKKNVELVNLDAIDLDNITIGDLQGLQAADGDTLRAKHLNNLSRKEREHVLQDIHGVADVMEETTNALFVDDSLKKLQEEINNELVTRKARKNVEKNDEGRNTDECKKPRSGASSKLPALEERLGKLQEKLDALVRERNSLNSSVKGVSDFQYSKQLSARNHSMFGKLGNIGGLGPFPFGSNSGTNNKNKSSIRPTTVPSSCFGGSSFFSPTTAIAKSSLLGSINYDTNEAQEDAAILRSKNAIAYEQALAQCRGRRRERNNSLFRPNLTDPSAEEDGDLDEGLYIDVEQREFRLSFLRAERYDTKKAATRFIEYFEERRRLFGVDNLTTKIKLKDLDVETKYCVESGHIQVLPGRDRAGRSVIVGTKKLALTRENCHDKNSVLRAFWFLSSIALEDIKTERNGIVFVNYAVGGTHDESNGGFSHRIRDWGNILRAMPLRVASIHCCVDNHKLKQTTYLSTLMLGASNFVRVRCHAGSDMEVQYDLNTFGIPTDLLPVSMTGEVDLSHHREFLQGRKKAEASTLLNKALALVEAPMLDDCIALDVNDEDVSTSVNNRNRFPNNPMVATESSFKKHNDFHHQNQAQFEQEQLNQTTQDFRYNTTNNNSMNKIAVASFNDAFSFMGNRNSVQVQSSMQQQIEQCRQQQQQFNGFQQHLGMNMGMVQHFSQNQQMQCQQQQHQLHQHQSTESKSGIAYSMEPVLVPGELDILLGRGRGAQNHKGNIHYRQVVETFRSRYEQIPQKGAKTQLIREVVAVIYDNGGRFLKQDGFGRWIPVDPEVARDKVSHSFRNQKRLSVGTNPPSGIELSSSKKRSRDETK